MSFKVPSIEDLVISEMKALEEKEEQLKVAEEGSWYQWDLKKSIKISKELLAKHKGRVRDEKLNQLGIDGD